MTLRRLLTFSKNLTIFKNLTSFSSFFSHRKILRFSIFWYWLKKYVTYYHFFFLIIIITSSSFLSRFNEVSATCQMNFNSQNRLNFFHFTFYLFTASRHVYLSTSSEKRKFFKYFLDKYLVRTSSLGLAVNIKYLTPT